jgi:hypothetical protein
MQRSGSLLYSSSSVSSFSEEAPKNMHYYHIAPSNLDRELSPSPTPIKDDEEFSSREEEDDDDEDSDPNWLMTTKTKTRKKRKYEHQHTNETTSVVVRRKKTLQQQQPPPEFNRLSRLLEGVTSAFIGGAQEEGQFKGNDDVIVSEEKQPLPVYYQNDPIAVRICELFDEMEPLENVFNMNNNLDDLVDLDPPPHELVLRRRRKQQQYASSRNGGEGGGGGFFSRRKQTVSGYFNDWSKWLRGGTEVENGQIGDGHLLPSSVVHSNWAASTNGKYNG